MELSRSLNVLFCDDIRHETTGKTTIVGCYYGTMIFPFMPVAIPRLCVFVKLTTPIDRPFVGKVSATVFKDSDILGKNELDGATIMAAFHANPTPFDPESVALVTGFEFAPLNIEKPCTLRVVVETSEGMLVSEKLHVLQSPSQ